MIKRIKIRLFCQLLLASVTSIGCKNEPETKKVEPAVLNKNDTTVFSHADHFRSWLRDTISKIDTLILPAEKESGVVAKRFTVIPDSLGLNIELSYDLIITPTRKINNNMEADKLISLLNEYDEKPDQSFRLRFRANQFYAPSPLPRFIYELTEDFDNILVISHDEKKTTEYAYIRARLAYKIVKWTDRTMVPHKEQVDFIWKGNQLKKILQ